MPTIGQVTRPIHELLPNKFKIDIYIALMPLNYDGFNMNPFTSTLIRCIFLATQFVYKMAASQTIWNLLCKSV